MATLCTSVTFQVQLVGTYANKGLCAVLFKSTVYQTSELKYLKIYILEKYLGKSIAFQTGIQKFCIPEKFQMKTFLFFQLELLKNFDKEFKNYDQN